MASKTCSSCLRTIQRHSRSAPVVDNLHCPLDCTNKTQIRQASRATQSRAFRTSATRHVELPGPNATPATSIPPVTPVTDEGKSKYAPSEGTANSRQVSGLKGLFETYSAYGATEVLFKECSNHAKYALDRANIDEDDVPKTADGEDLGVGEGPWHKEFGLPATFSTWSQVTMLHMYLIVIRLRCFPASSASIWQQHLVDHFFYDAENKMVINHNMQARGTRNKYLKDMFLQWRGLIASYDEGLAKGDAVLAAAVWRNVFKASEEVDVRHMALIVAYMRSAAQALDSNSDDVIQQAMFRFSPLEQEKAIAGLRSKMMELPFERAAGPKQPAKNSPSVKTG